MQDVDLVVAGAGSSGLAAAKVLHVAGLTFKVLGATGRIGGRAFTSAGHFGQATLTGSGGARLSGEAAARQVAGQPAAK